MAKAKTATAPAAKESKYKIVKAVTLPTLKFEDDTTRYFKIMSAIRLGSALPSRKDKDGKDQKPADVVEVTDIETGEHGCIVLGEVLKGEILKSYPNDSYIGKSFKIDKATVEGKRYRNYTVYEIEA